MSDYMFMLESHLSTHQNRVVNEVQAVAGEANVNVFLAGGAMRDMLGGFPIHDLDFTVEGNAIKLAKTVAQKAGAEIVSQDETRKSVELLFPGRVTAEIASARREVYERPGAKPQIVPATIYEDLRGRDFTINAIALSLSRASRGLLIDPTNGLADLEHKELRATHNYIFHEDPARLLRLIRFRVRLGFAIEERTKQQYVNAREAGLEKRIPPRRLFEELRQIAENPNHGEILRALEQERLISLFSPALSGPKLNLQGLSKLEKARQIVPFGVELPVENLGLFLYFVVEKLTPKERQALIRNTAMHKSEVALWQRIEPQAKKLERALKSPKFNKPSRIYEALAEQPGELLLFLLAKSPVRLVHDRTRNYLQKYLPAAQEVTDEMVKGQGAQPGTPKFRKLRLELIATRLDTRAKKPAEEPEIAPGPPPPLPARARVT